MRFPVHLDGASTKKYSGSPAISKALDVTNVLRELLGCTDIVQSVSEVYTIYKMKGGHQLAGFGGKLRGREGAQRAMAAEADNQAALRSRNGALTKDESSQVLCMWGIGTGKSRLLAAGLDAHKTYCTDPSLRAMLDDNNRCIQILISFNTSTAYTAAESANADQLLCRRLIAAVTGISWEDALKLDLSAKLTASACLNGILQYHREVRGLGREEPVFVFLGVDEVNQLLTDQPTRHSIDTVANITRSLRVMRDLPRAFVATMMAGTHGVHINEAMRWSGIRPDVLPYEPLSQDDIATILTEDAGVCREYMDSPHFQRLVGSAHPVLHPLGQLVAALPLSYDAEAVYAGEQVVATYFAGMTDIFSQTNLGRRDLVGNRSMSLDSLQNRGIIQIVPLNPGLHQVCLPLCQVEQWCQLTRGGSSAVISSAQDLLAAAKRAAKDSDSFKQFTARFLSMRLAALRRGGCAMFMMSDLLPSAHVTADLARTLFRIPAVCPLVPPADIVTLDSTASFPSDKDRPDLHQLLEDGGLVVNAPSAGLDIFAFLESHERKGVQWKPAGLAIAATKSNGTALSVKDVDRNRRRATKAFKQLQAPAPNHQRSCTVIHFTDRELAVDDTATGESAASPLAYDQKVQMFLKGAVLR